MAMKGCPPPEVSQWEITPEEFSCYFARYQHITPPGQYLSGEKARQFFLQTKIPLGDLSVIWDLSDVDGDGCLDAAEFSLAMHLIQHYLRGYPLPTSLPSPLLQCYQVALKPHLPPVSKEHVLKCKKVFEAFHKDLVKGVLNGESAKYLMYKTSLTRDQLRHICQGIADQDDDGHFTFTEFIIAMHLIFVAKLGYILPVNLDPFSILTPSILSEVLESSEDVHYGSMVGSTTPPNVSVPSGFASNHLERQQRKQEYFEYDDIEGQFYRPPNPFDDPPEDSGHAPQSYQIKTGSRRGLLNHGYSSEESLEPSMLSVIPEESTLEVQMAESHELLQQSHDLLKQSHNLLQQSHDSSVPHHSNAKSQDQNILNQEASKDAEREVPWYQDGSTSQDVWQTTPAYHSEEVQSKEVTAAAKRGERPAVNKLVVTEELKPVLQVALSVDIERPDDSSDEEGVGLTVEDLEELNTISQASTKFLAASEGASTTHATATATSDRFRDASLKGLEATIRDMETTETTKTQLRQVDQSANQFAVDIKPGDAESAERMMNHLEGLEAEILTSLLDITEHSSSEKGRIDRASRDQVTSTASRSHDQATMSHRHTTTSHDRTTTSRDQTTTSHATTSHDQIADKTTTSRGHQAPPSSSKAVTRGTQYPSTTDVTKSPTQDRPGASEEQQRKTTETRSPAQKKSSAKKSSSAMDDLDSLFEGELASIDQVFQEFEIKDKKKAIRNQTEEEDLSKVEDKDVVDMAPTLELLEEVSKRRSIQSSNIEQQWEEEMRQLEQKRLKAMEEQQAHKEPEDDIILNLDNQLQSLIRDKELEARHAHEEMLLREKREKEEKERKEKERLEKLTNKSAEQELTVEEWIAWMEAKKKKDMTPEQQAEYERRKKLRQEKEREKAERLRQEEEEKIRKTRERMENEMKSLRQRQLEVVESRLTEEELHQKQEEMAQRQLEESRLRKERGEKMRHDDRDREIEALKPKARSALAARWEESVKARSNGKGGRALQKATVMTAGATDERTAMEKEEERLVRRISGGYPNDGPSAVSPEKRLSMQ